MKLDLPPELIEEPAPARHSSLSREDLDMLPKMIEFWTKQMDSACLKSGLPELDLINAKIAICEAKRALDIARTHNANAADGMRER